MIKYTSKSGSGSFAGTPASLPAGLIATVSNNVANASIDLVITSTTATTPMQLGFSVGGNTLTLTWPGAYLSWIAQSNGLDLANPAHWFDISSSQSGTNLIIPLNPAQTNVFYRLRRPQ